MELNVMQEKKKDIVLTRTMKEMIEAAINVLPEEDAFNENKILFQITEFLIDKHPGDKLEYQLTRMHMETTTKIKQAIRVYMARYARVE